MPLTVGQIDKLGKRLREQQEISQQDLELLQEFRKSYSDALPFVFESLRKSAIKVDGRAIVTFRIKRIDTIINKLRRFEGKEGCGDMRLSRMWDIAGCRCIISTPNEQSIFKLVNNVVKSKEIIERRTANDYVTSPKPDGYRSYHMYVMREGTDKPIEIQIRNKEMHNWATLVEIFDILYGLGIKEGNKTNRQQEFLYLFSKKDQLSAEDSRKLIEIEDELHVFEDMCQMFSKNYYQVRKQWAVRKKGENFLVLEAGKGFSTTIDAFSSFEEAEECYYNKYLQRRNTNLVMVYSKSSEFSDISFAYSNYILSVHSFFFDYKKIIEECLIYATEENNTRKILHFLRVYKRTILKYFDCIHDEIAALNQSSRHENGIKIYQEEWNSDLNKELNKWQESVRTFTNKLSRSVSKMNNSTFHMWLFKFYFRRMTKGIQRKMNN